MHLLRAVAGGATFFSNEVVEALLVQNNQRQPLDLSEVDLSPREQQLVTMIFDGQTNDQIAQTLQITPQSVRNYLYVVYSKFGVRSRAALILHLSNFNASIEK